jgi:Holliday junction resolvase RusA-like endonuclease
MSKDNSTSFPPAQAISFTIFGEPASKANSRRIAKMGSMIRVIKSEKALNYSDAFKQQCPKLAELIECTVAVRIKIYYASRRPDLDESLILDLMQGSIYRNDRQVREKHIFWGLDPENPRAEIRVEPLQKKPPVSPGEKGERAGDKPASKV